MYIYLSTRLSISRTLAYTCVVTKSKYKSTGQVGRGENGQELRDCEHCGIAANVKRVFANCISIWSIRKIGGTCKLRTKLEKHSAGNEDTQLSDGIIYYFIHHCWIFFFCIYCFILEFNFAEVAWIDQWKIDFSNKHCRYFYFIDRLSNSQTDQTACVASLSASLFDATEYMYILAAWRNICVFTWTLESKW